MIEFKKLTELEPSYKKILIQGPVSAGKSWLAATIGTPEKPARIFDFDGKAEGLVKHPNRKNIVIASFIDKTAGAGIVPEPRAFAEFLGVLNNLEYEKSQGKYKEAYNIIDSLTFLEDSAVRQFLYSNPKSRKLISVSGTNFYIPLGWDAQTDSVAAIKNGVLSRLFALDDTVVIAHERPEEDRSSSETNKLKRLTGRFSLHPPRLDVLKSYFVEKYRVTCVGNSYYVQTQSNEDFLGASALLDVMPQEEADLAKLLAKDKAARMNQEKTQ